MSNLSPTAQLVWNAFNDAQICAEVKLAAALRVVADQVVPKGPKPGANSDYHLMNWTKSLDQYYQRQATRDELLAIAVELEGADA